MIEAPTTVYNIEEIRKAFPVLEEITYLNIGTYGIMPEPALREATDIFQDFERRGIAPKRNIYGGAEDARKKVGQLFDSEPDNIAFTRNASDGINLVLSGMDWQAGDEIITTDEEHEAIRYPLSQIARRRGVVVHYLQVSPEPEVMLKRLNEVASPRTRLVVMSFVTCETGTRLPMQAICQWTGERSILSLVDGAQASGVFSVNVNDLGCDFYASNGHKWLCGPKGTGIFYGKPEKIELLAPAHIGAGSLETYDLKAGVAELWHNARRFEFGTRSWPLHAALGASIDWFENLGWKNVYSHIESMNDYLKSQLKTRSYLKVLTPDAFGQSSGLTSFEVLNREMGEIVHALVKDWNIYTRPVSHYNALRISTAHFTNEADLDRLMSALDAIVLA